MVTIFEAKNLAEAHMVLHMLQQAGLSGRVDGEYLQGAAGKLQATGLIRVKIIESDFEQAKTVIQQWDAMRPSEEEPVPAKKSSHVGTGIFGFLSGLLVAALFYNTPITHDSYDHNGDNIIDQKWTYVDGYLSKLEWDRNFDGELDYISKYDRIGTVQSAKSDEDFNGTFESSSRHKNDNIVETGSDTNGDGFKDMRLKFNYGVLETMTFLNPTTKKPIKVVHYTSFKAKSAEVDTTDDGVLDSKYKYNNTEDVIDITRNHPN